MDSKLTRLLLLLVFALPVHGQMLQSIVNAKAAGGSFSSMTLIGATTTCPSSGTTCTVGISPNISAGQAVIACAYDHSGNDIWLASTDNSGTAVQVLGAFNWSNPSTALGLHSCLLIMNAGAESTNIVFTFSGTQTNPNAIAVWAGTYTGTPALDGANSFLQASSSTSNGTTFTPSSGSDTAVMRVVAFQNISSFTGMTADATGTHFGSGHNLSFSGALTPSATLAASASFVVNQEIYLGYNVTAPLTQAVQMFGGTNGVSPSASTLASGTFGYSGCAWAGGSHSTDFTYSTAASMTLQNATGRLIDGSNTTDSTTTGLSYATGNGNSIMFCGQQGHPFTSARSVTAGVWIQTNHSLSLAENDDTMGLAGISTDFALAQSVQTAGARSWSFECPSIPSTQFITGLSLNTQYWVEMYYNAVAPAANLTLTAAANASGGNTVYTGTITGGGSNALVGNYYYINTFTNAANNGGPFIATASTTTTLTLANASGVAETHAGNAAQTDSAGKAGLHTMKVYNNANPPGLLGQASCPAQGQAAEWAFVGNANIAGSAGYHYYFDGWKISFDGSDLLP